MMPMSFNEAHEIANGYYFVDDIVRKLDAIVIFNHYHQLEAIQPVSSEIIEKVCFIRDSFSVYSQLLGNKIADVDGRCWLHEAAGAHDPGPPIGCRLRQHRSKQSVRQRDRIRKILERCIIDTPARLRHPRWVERDPY
jgi:hypothetical protein